MIVDTAGGPVECPVECHVECHVEGTGPALLAIHGLPGDWRQLRSIAEDHTCEATVVVPRPPATAAPPCAAAARPTTRATSGRRS